MKLEQLDHIDTTILSELATNARASQVDLAERVGLSSTAIARRQKALEEEGFIRGYQAVLDLTRFGLSTTVLVRVTLESQNEDALKSFEAAVIECPSVVRCFLMSGSDDYIRELITLAFKYCTRGLGFNFLSTYANFTDVEMAYHDPAQMLDFCIHNLTRKVVMHHHYERVDVVVFAYR